MELDGANLTIVLWDLRWQCAGMQVITLHLLQLGWQLTDEQISSCAGLLHGAVKEVFCAAAGRRCSPPVAVPCLSSGVARLGHVGLLVLV